MSDFYLPIIITFIAIFVALAAYRGIRRGGARHYTLEREAVLRRAGLMLIASMLLFVGTISLLIYNAQPTSSEAIIEAAATVTPLQASIPTPTNPAQQVEVFPPTQTPAPAGDPLLPTVTPTAQLARGIVEGTAGAGLLMRDAPGGEEIRTIPDGTFVTLLDDPEILLNGYTWVNILTNTNETGWVAKEFLVTNE